MEAREILLKIAYPLVLPAPKQVFTAVFDGVSEDSRFIVETINLALL